MKVWAMRDELLVKISELTEEEKRILAGEELDKKFYTAESDFIINDKRLTKGVRDITMRTHPRFAPFPPHKHTFAEMMLVFSGEITHEIGDKRITLSAGDILLLNKHVTHSIELSNTADVGMNIIISDKFADLLSPRLDGTLFSTFFKENAKRDGAESFMCFQTGTSFEISNVTGEGLQELIDYLAEDPRKLTWQEAMDMQWRGLNEWDDPNLPGVKV
jgi:mannose-6-phosphate isomerase-like protein (cupin superfamily)